MRALQNVDKTFQNRADFKPLFRSHPIIPSAPTELRQKRLVWRGRSVAKTVANVREPSKNKKCRNCCGDGSSSAPRLPYRVDTSFVNKSFNKIIRKRSPPRVGRWELLKSLALARSWRLDRIMSLLRNRIAIFVKYVPGRVIWRDIRSARNTAHQAPHNYIPRAAVIHQNHLQSRRLSPPSGVTSIPYFASRSKAHHEIVVPSSA